MAGAGDELAARPGEPRAARRAAHRPSARGRSASAARSRSRAISASSCARVGGARVDRDRHARRARRWPRSARPRSRRPSRRCRRRAQLARRAGRSAPASTSASSRASIGVVPAWSARPSNTTAPARLARDRGDDAERLAEPLEHGALLDVQLEVRVGQLGSMPAAAHRPASPRRGTRRRRAARSGSRSAASIAATTPSAPSNRPAVGTLSRCEPAQTRASPRVPKRLPAPSRETSSPASRIQPAASSCAASSSAEYAGAVLRDRVDLVEALERRSSGQCSQHAPARRAGRAATTDEPDAPRRRRDERAEERRVDGAGAVEQRLLQPDRGAAAAVAGELDRGGEREAVPAHREHARDDEHRDEHGERRVEQQRRQRRRTRRPRARSRRSGREAARRRRPTSGRRRCARRSRAACMTASTAAAAPAESPRCVVEVEDGEARRRRAAARAASALPIESCQMRGSRSGDRPSAPSRQARRGRGPSRSTTAAERPRRRGTRCPASRSPSATPPARTIGGSAIATTKPLIGIAVCRIAEREAALSRREPVHHRAPARRLHARAAPRPRRRAARRAARSPARRGARAARRRRPPSPTTSTSRSPMRSVASPHGIRLTTEPTSDARDQHAGLRRARGRRGRAGTAPSRRRRTRSPSTSPARTCPRRGRPSGTRRRLQSPNGFVGREPV